MASNLVFDITDLNFQQEVVGSKGLVLVDFWAPWCGPCRLLGPIVEEVAELLKDKVKVCKMNVDDSPETSSQFGIRSIPTLILFKEGKKIDIKVGSLAKIAMKDWIESHS